MTPPNHSQIFRFCVAAESVGLRLDVFLSERPEPDVSRSHVKRGIDAGEVTVNGQCVKAGHKLRLSDEIAWSYAPPTPMSAVAQEIDLDIIFEDEHLAVVNKAAGMVVHPAPGHPDGTLVNAILFHFARLAATDDPLRPGIVHRIDKDTSGAIAITKTLTAQRHLAQLFATHEIERAYHALVHCPSMKDSGSYDTLHGRHPKNRLKFSGRVASGRHAVTHYRVLERFDHGVVLVECRLETGRTHQIRVHLSEANAPLLGDALYSGQKIARTKLISRQALHARTLGFTHIDGSDVSVEAPYPADFQAALDALRSGRHW